MVTSTVVIPIDGCFFVSTMGQGQSPEWRIQETWMPTPFWLSPLCNVTYSSASVSSFTKLLTRHLGRSLQL